MKVGDELFVVEKDRRGLVFGDPRMRKVTKVGRVYYQLEGAHYYQFRLDTLQDRSAYVSPYEVYRSKQAYLDEEERRKLLWLAIDFFHERRAKLLSLETLRQINQLINANGIRQ